MTPGDRLGPYEILAPIGKGGMGEVYRARDTKLDRDVAIKILPDALAQDPERLARFEREAKVLASLNHPNIAQIYGVEERALVMELVEGETLSGPVPIETALNYARQIADALEAAHEKGITHRDLKPANIMITPAGVIKVLDFGLAAVAQTSAEREGNPSNSPTLTMQATQAGMIMGTAAYMSPEQASGKPVDKRADIWSFGVVLWEMLTGKRLFDGETISHTLAAVLTKEPDLQQVPVKVRRLLQSCLQKDARQRLQAIGDWRLLLEEAPAASAPSRPGLGSVAGVLAVIAIVFGALLWRATRPEELKPLIRLDVNLTPVNSPVTSFMLSPDGTRIVYVSQGRLYTRRLDQAKAVELGTGANFGLPFFSPDGQWIAYFAGDAKLRKISVGGGASIALGNFSGYSSGGSWGDDGNLVVGLSSNGGLSRIPPSGGAATPLTELASGEIAHRWPQVLPGSKAAVFTVQTLGIGDSTIESVSFVDHRRKTLLRGGTFGRYLPSGHLVYINRGTLFAVPFDLGRLEIRGTPVPVVEDVAFDPAIGFGNFAFSQTGTLVYGNGGSAPSSLTVEWLDAAGKTQPLLTKADSYLYPHLSPDGQRLALSTRDIWVYELQRDTMARMTFVGSAVDPIWSPDGRYIVFQDLKGGLLWTRSDGAGKPQPLTQGKGLQVPYSFRPDGKRLAFHQPSGETGFDLWTVSIESDAVGLRAGKPEPFLQTQFNERAPVFSPDGQWLAYSSDESGSYQVYVRAFPDKGGKWQISNNGGVYPVWARSRPDLFFRTEDSRVIMAASYTIKGDSFIAEKPRVWSEKRLANVGLGGTNFDVAPDGKRIAALMPAETDESQTAQTHFLINFFDELRRKVPVAK